MIKKFNNTFDNNNVCDIEDLFKKDRVVIYKPQTYYKFKVDGEKYLSDSVKITGSELFDIAEVNSSNFDIYQITKNGEEKITPEETIDFSKKGIERFIIKKKSFKLLVNASPKLWKNEEISFEEVVILAFGHCDNGNVNKAYTVTYANGPKENRNGSMVKGDKVIVKSKMRFNVTSTDKS
ncbi:multiubiquitin domain-containing protein [Flammeovirga yaeyamensis]|uniref:Multiubiquitin domain-containing protein n=1 Tax=Flammeovirga yaeyamensis TaxID=367791 RepID=A0AAX1N9P1_9BACT|nr:multiubiquitin domain-containing protein [Flammeovirga yaeyamensis]MBB3701253.1 hypothetical protein [Flammeovirga yaeyamensis]NMF38276.1 hypothetical protein [Flammeovirga yaeyamensis]QWG02688.1 multiubiquitin domain-containing protein [Flammeovirga yaeyamensis]